MVEIAIPGAGDPLPNHYNGNAIRRSLARIFHEESDWT